MDKDTKDFEYICLGCGRTSQVKIVCEECNPKPKPLNSKDIKGKGKMSRTLQEGASEKSKAPKAAGLL